MSAAREFPEPHNARLGYPQNTSLSLEFHVYIMLVADHIDIKPRNCYLRTTKLYFCIMAYTTVDYFVAYEKVQIFLSGRWANRRQTSHST